MNTWTDISQAKRTALEISKRTRWNKGKKYLPLYRKAGRFLAALWAALDATTMDTRIQAE